jgi:hypothetical protein
VIQIKAAPGKGPLDGDFRRDCDSEYQRLGRGRFGRSGLFLSRDRQFGRDLVFGAAGCRANRAAPAWLLCPPPGATGSEPFVAGTDLSRAP